MKCYLDRADTGRVEQISLGEAVRFVAEYNSIPMAIAADVLQKSRHSNTVLVDDGCVWIEDDVPVLDLDPVLKDWWALRVKELPDGYHHVLISLIKWTDNSTETRVAAVTCDAEHEFIELNSTQCEPIITQLKEIKRVSAKPTDTQPQDAGTDEPGSERWADYPPF